ncbi:unnamed protein product [Soboliphyme baturini]|uniref:Phosphoglycerate mutase family protein n=1 Tax=Soboliphyme baturini TaxID=241478 RepID=A0A183IXF2_9BILA|nr:unnamed protein product [Soboliphyme baturini]
MDNLRQLGIKGEYMPYDANLPVRLPKRIGGRMAYRCDCPITILGRLEAKMIGRALHSKNLLPQRIFVSPAMRCIATARGLLKGLQMSGLRMCIEPGLCKVDKKYTPVMTREQVEVCQSERVQQFYERCGKVVRKLLENNADVKSMLLIVHSSTMDAISRELLGHRPEALSRSQMEQMGFYYPYSAFVAFEEQKEDNTWHVIDDALPPLTCRKFSNCVDRAFLDRP